MRLSIIHCPAGGGHRAAASALAEQATSMGFDADIVDALSFTPAWFAKSYVQMHLSSTHLAPWAYGYGYHRLNRRHPTWDRVRRRIDGVIASRLLAHLHHTRPDVVIGTHFFPLSVLGRARVKGRLSSPLVGIVTDFAAHAFWAEPGVDAYCVTPGGAALDLARHGVPRTAIHATGIPIRPAFGRIPDAPTSGPLRVLVTSGGFGIGPLEQAIASFRDIPDVELTVVCGADPRRRERTEAIARHAGLRATVLGYERDMPARMRQAHIVLGKPGGLTVSESLAAGRPMALMGTCPGQEAHNAEWLTLNGAAVTVDPHTAGRTLTTLRSAGQLPIMATAARRLGTPRAAHDALLATLTTISPVSAQAA